MKQAAKMLDFEEAAKLRDQIIELRKIMEGSPADILDRVVAIDATTKQTSGNGQAKKTPVAAGSGGGNRGGKPGGRRRARYS